MGAFLPAARLFIDLIGEHFAIGPPAASPFLKAKSKSTSTLVFFFNNANYIAWLVRISSSLFCCLSPPLAASSSCPHCLSPTPCSSLARPYLSPPYASASPFPPFFCNKRNCWKNGVEMQVNKYYTETPKRVRPSLLSSSSPASPPAPPLSLSLFTLLHCHRRRVA